MNNKIINILSRSFKNGPNKTLLEEGLNKRDIECIGLEDNINTTPITPLEDGICTTPVTKIPNEPLITPITDLDNGSLITPIERENNNGILITPVTVLDNGPLTNENGAKTLKDILEDAIPEDKTGGPSTIFKKPGKKDPIKAANDDFDALKPSNVKDQGNGMRSGTLENGDGVVVRPISRGEKNESKLDNGEPTLEVQHLDPVSGKKTKKKTKIRYTED